MINVVDDKDVSRTGGSRVRIYSNLMKILLMVILLYSIWLVFVITGIYYLNLGYRWGILSMEEWFIIGCIIYGLTLILEVICILRVKPREYRVAEVKSTPTVLVEKKMMQDKTIWVYTHPEGAKGGVYSRTYIPIDNDNYLQLRVQLRTQDKI